MTTGKSAERDAGVATANGSSTAGTDPGPADAAQAVEVDGLRLAGTLLLLVRSIDQRQRQGPDAGALAFAELHVLGQVERGVDCPSHLARALRLDPARVTHLTDRLVADGRLTRSADPIDRRRWRLSLTAAGREGLAEGRTRIRATVEALLIGLTSEERAGLEYGLLAARRVLDAASGPVS